MFNIKSTAINNIIEAIAWVMKYFIDDSAENMFFSLENSGMIDNKFISKPIHIDIHE